MTGVQTCALPIWGDFNKTAVTFTTGCAAGGPDGTLLPVRAGADTVTVTETHNGKRVSSAAHTVYVAQSALAQPEDAGEEG